LFALPLLFLFDVAPVDAVAEVERALAADAPTTTAVTASKDAAADLKAIRAAFVAKHFAILREDADTLVVERDHHRAWIALGDTGGRMTVTPHPASTVAPGKCVAIPQITHAVDVTSTGINDAGERGEGHTFWKLQTLFLLDVDGDGIPDAFVPQPTSADQCPEAVMWRVYVMRGACGHDLGVVGPAVVDVSPAPLDASGFRPLTSTSVTTRLGAQRIPDHITTTTRYAVTKGRYQPVDTKQQVGICHHCATWTCSKH
jgi:hypothetical protein